MKSIVATALFVTLTATSTYAQDAGTPPGANPTAYPPSTGLRPVQGVTTTQSVNTSTGTSVPGLTAVPGLTPLPPINSASANTPSTQLVSPSEQKYEWKRTKQAPVHDLYADPRGLVPANEHEVVRDTRGRPTDNHSGNTISSPANASAFGQPRASGTKPPPLQPNDLPPTL